MLLVDTAVWWVVTGQIIAASPAVVAGAALQGWSLQLGQADRTGWPFTATVVVQNVSASSGSFRWASPSVSVELPFWEPTVVRVRPNGMQSVDLNGHAATIIGGPIIVRAPLSDGPITFDARNLAMGGSGSPHLQHLAGILDHASLTLTAENLQPGPPLAPPLETGIQLSARVLTTQPFTPGLTPEASARAWQAAGGRLDMPDLDLRWGSLHVTGTASGGLDQRLQPTGQAHLNVLGADPVLDALARAGLLQPGPASAARAVLQILTLAAHGSPVPVPMTLADDILTVAGFPLLRTAPLDWAGP